MKKYFQIGLINVSVVGEGRLFEMLCDDLTTNESTQNNQIDLEIRILSPHESFDFESIYTAGSISVSNTGYIVSGKAYTYQIENLFNTKMTTLIIKYNDSKFSNPIYQCLDFLISLIFRTEFQNYMGRSKNAILSYSLMWYVMHIILLKKQCAFFHGGSVDFGGSAIALTGAGGCGKTSNTLKLLETENSKYISEDFGIVDTDGNTHLSCRPLAIYHSDVKHKQKDLVRFEKEFLHSFNKLNWILNIKLGKNPLRRVSPLKLFGPNKLCHKSKLTNIYYLVRFSGDNLCLEDISLKDLAERCTETTFREINVIFEILSQIHSVSGGALPVPSIQELKNQTNQVYMRAFKNVTRKILFIPKTTAPDEIIQIVNTNSE